MDSVPSSLDCFFFGFILDDWTTSFCSNGASSYSGWLVETSLERLWGTSEGTVSIEVTIDGMVWFCFCLSRWLSNSSNATLPAKAWLWTMLTCLSRFDFWANTLEQTGHTLLLATVFLFIFKSVHIFKCFTILCLYLDFETQPFCGQWKTSSKHGISFLSSVGGLWFFSLSCLFRLDLVLNDFLQFSLRQVKTILTKNHFNSTTIIIQNKSSIRRKRLVFFTKANSNKKE